MLSGSKEKQTFSAESMPHPAIVAGAASQEVVVDSLIDELDRYRRQSEWLQQVNALHSRLAGALDLPTVIETFSVWLMPMVSHDLIAYRNTERNRSHVFCSSHGPSRRSILKVARTFLEAEPSSPLDPSVEDGRTFIRRWHMEESKSGGQIMLLRKNQNLHDQETRLVDETRGILNEAVHRALNYEDLFEQAKRDSLTGLSNRRVFEERAFCQIQCARRHERPLTLASMDLDHFKQINDSFGHLQGDDVLKRVAAAMAAHVRTSDLLVRMGGDEFMLLLPETTLKAAKTLAIRLKASVDALHIIPPDGRPLSVSIGLARWKDPMILDEWIQKADEALYRAKTGGRSKICSART